MSTVTLPLGGYTDDYSYYGVSSSYPLTNAVGSTSSSGTKYAGINLTRRSGAETYVYMTFDTSEIPSDVIIKSVTGSVRLYGSTTAQNRTTTREIQLYAGSTAKGSAAEFNCTGSATITEITDGGSWTRDELDNICIKLYLVRNSSDIRSNTYIYWLGADVTIEYEEGKLYTVNAEVGDGITATPNGESQIIQGSSYKLQMTLADGISIQSATDNGVNVLNSITQAAEMGDSGSLTANPAAYTTSGNIRGTYYRNAVGQGSSNTATGNDYCSTSGSTATVYYTFDFSSIPENAEINSVSVVVGGHLESTSSSSEVANLQLYSGSTKKGSQSAFSSTSKELVTMTAGTWTRAELQEAKLAFTIGYYGGQVNGVDFKVSYSVPGKGVYYIYTINSVTEDHIIRINMDTAEATEYLYFKNNGTFIKAIKVYKKINGTWIEQKDLPNLFEGIDSGTYCEYQGGD